jgi:hypothetical protein
MYITHVCTEAPLNNVLKKIKEAPRHYCVYLVILHNLKQVLWLPVHFLKACDIKVKSELVLLFSFYLLMMNFEFAWSTLASILTPGLGFR